MGTFWEIEVVDEKEEKAKKAVEAAFSEAKRLEHLLSRYRKESEVSKLNREAFSSAVAVSQETFKIIELAVEYSRVFRGAFDITIVPLISCWQMAQDKKLIPAPDDIREVLSLVGCDNLVLDSVQKTVRFRKNGMGLDLGALAKGFAMDSVIKILRENGIRKAMVNAGGEIYIMGDSLQGQKTSLIGIKNPLKPDQIAALVELNNQAVSTTANYERFSLIEGKHFGHIINPFTGYPADGLLSISVIAMSCTEADIFSTALFVAGGELELGKKFPACGGVIVMAEKNGKLQIDYSNELADKIKLM